MYFGRFLFFQPSVSTQRSREIATTHTEAEANRTEDADKADSEDKDCSPQKKCSAKVMPNLCP